MSETTNMDSTDINNELKDLDQKESGLLVLGQAAELAGLSVDRFPDSSQEGSVAERVLAEDLEKLSFTEKERVLFDIYGIAEDAIEDPEDLEIKLDELEREIQRIRRKEAYELAKYFNEPYVTDKAFRHMFLKYDNFDPKLSAQRLVRHFDVKKKLFGKSEILGRDVLLSDLSKDDMKALESGFVQIFPSCDASGRYVLSVAPMYRPAIGVLHCTRSLWYMFNSYLTDERVAQKGWVVVSSNFGAKAQKEQLSMLRQIHYVRSGIPHRFSGIHYCYDDILFKPFVTGMRMALNKESRSRVRVHFGSTEEIMFELQTFGITTEDHPLKNDGKLQTEWHQKWLQAQREVEVKSERRSNPIIHPRRFDVLFGRGVDRRQHTGNLRANHVVSMLQEEYEQAGKFEKTRISERVVKIIQDSHGRFLKWDRTGWVEVSDDVAREKVSHFFRHLRSKTVPQTTEHGPITTSAKRITPCASPEPTFEVDLAPGKHARVNLD